MNNNTSSSIGSGGAMKLSSNNQNGNGWDVSVDQLEAEIEKQSSAKNPFLKNNSNNKGWDEWNDDDW